MQVGRMETIDHAVIDHTIKTSKVENLDKKHTIQPDEQYKNVANQTNKIHVSEIELDNVTFGFDQELGEFFVRLESDTSEIRFPTEQIMKMKAFVQNQLKNEV